MKKIYVLVMLGTFLIVGGVLMRTYAYPQLAIVPVDTDATVIATSLEGEPATYFDVPSLSEKTAELINVTRARVNWAWSESASRELDREVLVFETYVCTNPTSSDESNCLGNPLPLSGEANHFAVDAKTGELVRWAESRKETGGEVQTDLPYAGYVLKLPFNVQKQDYQMWESTLQKTVTARYVRETTLAGVRAYEYEQTVEPTVTGTIDVPGSLAGSTEPTVTAELVHSSTSTILVEPETGALIGGSATLDDYATVDGERIATTTSGTFAVSDEDTAEAAKDAQKSATGLHLLRVTGPIVGIGGGVLLLALAGLLRLRRAGTNDAQRKNSGKFPARRSKLTQNA